MSLGGIILLLAFLTLVIAVVLWPLMGTPRRPGDEFGIMPVIAQLKAEREAILQVVSDLDFDYQTGKLPQEDYLVQRESLMRRGVEILRQIEAEQTAAVEKAIAATRTRES